MPTQADAPLHLRLLGAPRLMRGDAEVRLTIRKSLALLTVVAIERRTTRAKLASLFWGDGDGDAARRNLRRELHRLREAGLGDALLADDDAVAVSPRLDCDVHRFLAALQDDRVHDAAAAYTGPLIDGFDLADGGAFDDWLAQQRELLARRYSEAARRHAEALEAAGDAGAALQVYTRLIAHEPLQESHYTNAMRLHYLLGDRAQALDLFERLRQALRRELDLDPLPETAALAERVRAAERVAPLVSRAGGPGLARFDAALVGREAELARLDGGAAVVTLIEGDAGVGKTRLATEFALGRTPYVRLAGSELGRNAALHPVAETLRAVRADPALRARLQALPEATLGEVARLVPELRETPPAPASGGAAARVRFFEALSDALAAAVDGGALLVDDLHWLDDSTLEALEALAVRLARTDGPPRARIVATARTAELAESRAAIDVVLKLERSGLLQRLPLAPLDAGGTLALVRNLSGSAGGELFAQRLQRVTQGNPYFMLETLRFLFDIGELRIDESGLWSTRYDGETGDYRELPVPPSVQQAVVERVERLGPAARRVLETAALAGDPFTLDDVQPATALTDWDALDGLERALQAQLLLQADGGYRYVHDLARSALDHALRPERRRLIHLRLAESLDARRGAPGRIAGHLELAGRAGQAVPHRLAAARAAESVFAWREALEHLQAALVAQAPAARMETHRERIRLLRLVHELAGEESELDAMEALGRELDDPAIAAEVLCGRAILGVRRQRYTETLQAAESAMAHPAFEQVPIAVRDALPLNYAFALVERARYDEARAIYDHALATSAGRPPAFRGELHHGYANYYTSFGRDAEARDHLRQAVELFREAGDIQRELRSLNILAYTEFQLRDTPRAIEIMDVALAQAERLNLVTVLRNTLTNFIAYLLPAGQVERAQAVHQRAMQLFGLSQDPATQARLVIRECEIRTHLGDLGAALAAIGEAIDLIERNLGGFPDFWAWHLRGRLQWWCGDYDTPPAQYRSLRDSPAYLPTSEAPIRLYSIAYSLRDDPEVARRAASDLAELEPVRGMVRDRETIDFWRAYALIAAGEPAQALAILEPDGAVLVPTPFGEHPGRYVALRVAARAALGQDVEPLRTLTEQVRTVAPAPVHLELLAAWCRAAPSEPSWRDDAQALARRLNDSLAVDPALQQRFRERWRALLA
jgi:DNA-binding SARP family transcriptional activator